MLIRQNTKKNPPAPLHVRLAPSYTDVEELPNALDENNKIMVAFVNRVLHLSLPHAKTFEDIQGILNAHAALVIRLKETIPNHKILSKGDARYFDFGDSPSKDVVRAMETWVTKELIADEEVVKLAGFDDSSVIRGLLTFTSSHLMSLLSAVYSKDIEEKDIFDLGIIQYPDSISPYFRLRRIRLYVWGKRTSIGVGAVKWTESGIRGEFMTYIYGQNAQGIADLSTDQRGKILVAFNDFVNQLPGMLKPADSTAQKA
ncbi:hypothetical protein B0H21DRAFT_825772 [Amylocystis lapponica]|nr:hypothetical protein B0H21DRAFT_825772 [Amylocystis lapponica]